MVLVVVIVILVVGVVIIIIIIVVIVIDVFEVPVKFPCLYMRSSLCFIALP